MARRGRPRKSGKRTKSDRLSRAGYEPSIIRGNDHAEARKARYGTEGCDPVGRAYIAGLLGEGSQAKERLDNARRFARAYRATFTGAGYRCALDTGQRGVVLFQTRRQRIDELWLRSLDIDTALRPYFDQLVLPANPDNDPHWLTALFTGSDYRDRMILDAALKALDSISQPKPRKIREAC
jgi:hypothetical protein